ncbi:scaffolding protein [Arthrobacter phage Bauer]|uniref:Scaffolding protein n=1 Tax=Arthrobacter phage Bauer TaxID=2985648 RepID=A0A9E8AAC8_9CAUD|nr:scaffolding protein [Arthrobacter phage Bauer]UUG69966.1 scaffolding protein [Arthrobacter phage Zucker]UYM26556.1 scaffolding protein [Arthrobacter phage Bauer]
MNKRFPHGIDITAPGGLTALMDFHRLTFGDAVMEVEPDAAAQAAADAAAKAAADAAAGTKPDEKLGEPGLKALQAERDARAKAEKDAADAKAELQKIKDGELSDIQRAQKERDDAAANAQKLERENWRLSALADNPVPEKYRHLVTGTDATSYAESAKAISELAAAAEGKAPPKNDPVPGSGKRGEGSGNAAGGSLAAGRELYEKKHKKNS